MLLQPFIILCLHAGMWIKEHLHNLDHCNRVLKEFSNAWQYVMSHLSGECHRKVCLNQFGEDNEGSDENNCDVNCIPL